MESIIVNNNYLKNKSGKEIAAFAYIPLIGWIIPLYSRKEDDFCKHHARQGFLLSVIFTITAVLLNVTNIMLFTLQEFEDFRVGLIITIYAVYALYLIVCLISFFLAAGGKRFNFPLIKHIAGLIEL